MKSSHSKKDQKIRTFFKDREFKSSQSNQNITLIDEMQIFQAKTKVNLCRFTRRRENQHKSTMKYSLTCVESLKKEIIILLELNGFTEKELELHLISILDIADDVVLNSLKIKPKLEDLLLDQSKKEILLVNCYAIQEDINLLLFTLRNIRRNEDSSFLSYKKGSEKNITLLRKSKEIKVYSANKKYSKYQYNQIGFGNTPKSYNLIVMDNNYCMMFWRSKYNKKYIVYLYYKAKLKIESEVLDPPSRKLLFTFKENELILYRLKYLAMGCSYNKLSIQCPPVFFENVKHPKTLSNHDFGIIYDGFLRCLRKERAFSKNLKVLERREKSISKILLNWWNDRKWTVKNHMCFSKEFRCFIENLLFIQKFNCSFSKISLDVLQHCIIPFISEIEFFLNENKSYYCFRKCLNLKKEVRKVYYESYKDFKIKIKENELKLESNDFFSMFEGVYVLKELINYFGEQDYSLRNKFDFIFDIILKLLKCLIDTIVFDDQFLKYYMIKKIINRLDQAISEIRFYKENILLKEKKKVQRICTFLDNNKNTFFNAIVTDVFIKCNHNISKMLSSVLSSLMELKIWSSTISTTQLFYSSLVKFLKRCTKDLEKAISYNIPCEVDERRYSVINVLGELFEVIKKLAIASRENGISKKTIRSLATELKTIFYLELKFNQNKSAIFNNIFRCLISASSSKVNFEIIISEDSFITGLFFRSNEMFKKGKNMFLMWIFFVIKRLSFKRLNKFFQCEMNNQIKQPIIPLLNHLETLSSYELDMYRIKVLHLILMKDDFEMKKDDEVDKKIRKNALFFLNDLLRIEDSNKPLNLTDKENERILFSLHVINNYIKKGYPPFEFCFKILKYLSRFLQLRKDFFLMYSHIIDVIVEIVDNFVKKGTFNKKEVEDFSLFQKKYSIMLKAKKIMKEFKQVMEVSELKISFNNFKNGVKIEYHFKGLNAIISCENISRKLEVEVLQKFFEAYLKLICGIIILEPPKEILYCLAYSFINVVNEYFEKKGSISNDFVKAVLDVLNFFSKSIGTSFYMFKKIDKILLNLSNKKYMSLYFDENMITLLSLKISYNFGKHCLGVNEQYITSLNYLIKLKLQKEKYDFSKMIELLPRNSFLFNEHYLKILVLISSHKKCVKQVAAVLKHDFFMNECLAVGEFFNYEELYLKLQVFRNCLPYLESNKIRKIFLTNLPLNVYRKNSFDIAKLEFIRIGEKYEKKKTNQVLEMKRVFTFLFFFDQCYDFTKECEICLSVIKTLVDMNLSCICYGTVYFLLKMLDSVILSKKVESVLLYIIEKTMEIEVLEKFIQLIVEAVDFKKGKARFVIDIKLLNITKKLEIMKVKEKKEYNAISFLEKVLFLVEKKRKEENEDKKEKKVVEVFNFQESRQLSKYDDIISTIKQKINEEDWKKKGKFVPEVSNNYSKQLEEEKEIQFDILDNSEIERNLENEGVEDEGFQFDFSFQSESSTMDFFNLNNQEKEENTEKKQVKRRVRRKKRK